MDDHIDPTTFGLDDRFAIGQPVPRSEDPVQLRGEGRYSDDVTLPGQAYAVMVRSHHAHGVIRGLDAIAARAMPGVLAVYTAADLAAGGIGPLPPRQVMNNRDGTPMLSPVRYALATDKVRHVGDAVAVVIGETVAAAKDAAEAVVVDIEPLPAVSEPDQADAPGAPQIYDEVPGNVGLDFHYGDSEAVAAAFARAAHVTRLDLRANRIVVNAMEPRSANAQYDPARGHWTLHIGCQGVFGFRNYIAGVLGGVVDVDRQEAALIVMGVEQRELLMAVNDIHRIVDVERHRRGGSGVAGAVEVNHHAHQADQIAQRRRIFPARDGRLRAQVPAGIR